jgi:hypothetical protein
VFWFRRMGGEREGIKPAHRETFQWVFGPFDGMTQQTKVLARWMREDSGIFFVSGKVGSGKSTADLKDSLARVMNIYHTRQKPKGCAVRTETATMRSPWHGLRGGSNWED